MPPRLVAPAKSTLSLADAPCEVQDTVIVADAHKYLLDLVLQEFYDFVWSSPPCPSHSRINVSQYTRKSWKPKYPDMSLYQEIIFLKHFYKGKYCIENVIPYYDCLIPGKQRGRHLYWTNFRLPSVLTKRKNPDLSRTKNLVQILSNFHDYDFTKYNGSQSKQKVARNLVDYEAGKTIFQTLIDIKENKTEQIGLFK